LGKAPQNVDITALRHTEIVYHRRQRSAKPCSTAVGRRCCWTTCHQTKTMRSECGRSS
jgi:hypothetical protein